MKFVNIYKKAHPAFLILLLGLSSIVSAQIKVVTTLPDLASITRYVGGDQVEVFSIAKGYQNPHFVDPKPSYIVKLSRADMFVTVGLDLEKGWAPQLVESSRNSDIQQGSAGYVDASEGISLLQVPQNINPEEGDIHIYGNPHYWLDPLRGKQVAENIHKHLIDIAPEHRKQFTQNLDQFKKRIDEKMTQWQEKMKPYKGTSIIAYHNEWVYFEKRFGLEIVDFLEPKPGIPPTPSQLVNVIKKVESQNIPVLINSPYFSSKSPKVVARNTGIELVKLSTMTGGYDEIENYIDLFDYNINTLIEALENQQSK
ncbi:metal ABC transporter substrate-binding protein [Fodinibius sp. SL11]|uniref:metal ABC transporter substrate-binding protein n=1 Tax=Fodinibius sp. SL11 TaxID=3425690 RepID=UPI003F880A31